MSVEEEDHGWSTSDGDRSWIATFEGGKVHPMELRPGEITLDDLARGLSTQARFVGRTSVFYSVAQHLVLCARQARREDQLGVLFHDAEEAYPPGDIPRPCKRHPLFHDLAAVQAINRVTILARFGIPSKLPDSVKEIDSRMLATEKLALFPTQHPGWHVTAEPYVFTIVPWTPEEARRTWLGTAMALLAGKEFPCSLP